MATVKCRPIGAAAPERPPMSRTSEERFELLIGQAMSAPVSGWRFPFLDERLVRVPQSWDYVAAARALLKDSSSAIDHGTGGGEILLDTGVIPPRLVATEAYLPNVAVAQRHLQPVGAWVVQVSAETHNSLGTGANNEVPSRRLPFRDEVFDLFMCRNGAFCAGEVSDCYPREVSSSIRAAWWGHRGPDTAHCVTTSSPRRPDRALAGGACARAR